MDKLESINKTETITTRLRRDIKREALEKCRERGVTLSTVIRVLILMWLMDEIEVKF